MQTPQFTHCFSQVGTTDGELVDVELFNDLTEDELKIKLEKVLPKESKIISIVKIPKNAPAIDITAQWAEYKVDIFNKSLYDFESLRYNPSAHTIGTA